MIAIITYYIEFRDNSPIAYVMLLDIIGVVCDKIGLSHKGSAVIIWFPNYVNLCMYHMLGVYKSLYLKACFTIISVIKR